MYDKELNLFKYILKIPTMLSSTKWGTKLIHSFFKLSKGRDIKGLDCEEIYIPSKHDNYKIRIRIFRPKNATGDLTAMLYIHGGGYISGIPEMANDLMKQYIQTRPCVIISPDYRLSMKNPYPAGFNDCYDTLLWMKENAQSIGIKPSKFIVAGHSAGGGMTAAVTLKARDTKDVDIAFQMPVYPMIDYRQNTTSAKEMTSVPIWNSSTNKLAWEQYLKGVKNEVPKYASPAIETNYKNLPPAITFVGTLDPFKDETINYVEALIKENIPVEFKLFKGAYHGFEVLSKRAAISKSANQFQFDSFADFFDKYTT